MALADDAATIYNSTLSRAQKREAFLDLRRQVFTAWAASLPSTYLIGGRTVVVDRVAWSKPTLSVYGSGGNIDWPVHVQHPPSFVMVASSSNATVIRQHPGSTRRDFLSFDPLRAVRVTLRQVMR